jgi:hypothetical protein
MISKRFIFHLLLIFFFYLLEITFARIFTFPGAYLSLILIAGISLFFLDYNEEALWWFLFGGLLIDINSLTFFGLNTAIMMLIYFLINFVRQKLIHQPNLFFLAGVLSSSVFLLTLGHWLMLENKNLIFLLSIYGQSLLINFIFIWIIYLFFIYLSSWLSSYGLFIKE